MSAVKSTAYEASYTDTIARATIGYVIYEYFSRYLELVHMDCLTIDTVIKWLQNIITRHGIPETVHSDGGKQFMSSKFQQFARDYGFSHITSSSKFPQSNGAAESAVALAKIILIKSQHPNLGLLAYRATPLESEFSPAELLFDRKLRTTLPVVQTILQPCWEHGMLQSIRECDSYLKTRSKLLYDRRHRV
ncbi:hypothetical protein PR048_011729 [Dryococelus australis]|uniref:Integrase catalytic domain-containing protein n=1 Tax=Dryococelus australis TaxID=614101 RepID=A0ABQ9HN61_9NEOP|nr:hypothetical protein PR048_011729 [Dryococelus australis]